MGRRKHVCVMVRRLRKRVPSVLGRGCDIRCIILVKDFNATKEGPSVRHARLKTGIADEVSEDVF